MTEEQIAEAHNVPEEYQGKPMAELACFLHKMFDKDVGNRSTSIDDMIDWLAIHLQYVESQKLELVYRPLHAGEHNVGVF